MSPRTSGRAVRLLALSLLFTAACAATAAPAFLSLEGEWRFQTDPDGVGETQGWHQPHFDDGAWKRVRVPAAWEDQEAPNYDGIAWYRLRLAVPPEWRRHDLRLMLGRVDDLDRTYVNGILVGETQPSTPVPSQVWRVYRVPRAAVRFGQENVIAVRVRDLGGPGGMSLGPLALFPIGRTPTPTASPRSRKMDLKSAFQNPPAHRRILKLIHQLPSQPEAIEGLLLSLAGQGFGGMVTNVNFKGYLRDEANWPPLQTAVRRAREMEMTVWLYDEQGYPSGAGGGLTLEGHPEWEARGLRVVDLRTAGQRVETELPAGRVVSLAAYPVEGDAINVTRPLRLESSLDSEQRLRWTPPPGEWRVLGFVEGPLFEGTHAAANLFEKRPYINLLQREPTARFIQLTHQAYAARFPDFRKVFEATFTDEPSLMSVFMQPQPYAALPWA
ncbi:MAG: hypothetical protein QHJ73_16935, partial [Armatimonadota bacterium]|nr:hypothetical protein [Armatimonadota bacterium]